MILPILLLMFQPLGLENEFITAQMVTNPPHAKSVTRQSALDRVMIYLDEGKTRIENVSGLVENQTWKAGQVAWNPAGGEYTTENVEDKALRVVEIGLKPSVPSGNSFKISRADPVTVDPKHYQLEFENAKVRVIHGKYNLHEEGVPHVHLNNRLVVYLTDKGTDVMTRDGKEHPLKAPVDFMWWSGPAGHRDGAADQHIEMFVVEIK